MSESPVRTDWIRVALLFLAGLLAAAQFGKVSLSLASHAVTFGREIGSVSMLVSLTSVAGVIFGTTAGMIVARFGARSMLLGALCLGGALSIFQAILPAFPLFFASRLIEGLSHLVIVVAAPTAMIAAARVQDQPVVMGIWGMFFGVSFAVSALVFPGILGHGGLPLLLAGHGLLLWCVAAALWRVMPPVAISGGGWSKGGVLAEHLAIYRNPHTLAPALTFLWHTLAFVAILTFTPPIIGWGGVAFPVLSLAGTFGAGLLARHIHPLRIAVTAFAVAGGAAAALAVFSESHSAYIPLILLYFLSNGLIPGCSFAAIPALNGTPGGRARANGALAQLGNVGTALGTPMFALTLVGGFSGLFILAAALCAVGGILILLIHRNLARRP